MKFANLSSPRPTSAAPLRAALSLLVLALLAASQSGYAQPPATKEYQLKAAFLFHFVEFVEWPDSSFPEATTPIHIGILGDDPFGSALESMVKGQTIRNRPLVIQRSQRMDDLKSCQVIFVSKSERGHVPEILTNVGGVPILTVSEIDGFAHRGGVINFYLEGNKVRFEINPRSAQQQNLKLSSQLLSLGKIVAQLDEGRRN